MSKIGSLLMSVQFKKAATANRCQTSPKRFKSVIFMIGFINFGEVVAEIDPHVLRTHRLCKTFV